MSTYSHGGLLSLVRLIVTSLFRTLEWLCQKGESEVEISHSTITFLGKGAALPFATVWHVRRDMDRWRGRGLVSSGLTCLCSDPVLQCAAVQMMSSPPAACCSKCDARSLQREDGGRHEWEGRRRRQGRWAAKQQFNNTVTLLTASLSLVYSLVTVCGSRRGHSHIFRADCDVLFYNITGYKNQADNLFN